MHAGSQIAALLLHELNRIAIGAITHEFVVSGIGMQLERTELSTMGSRQRVLDQLCVKCRRPFRSQQRREARLDPAGMRRLCENHNDIKRACEAHNAPRACPDRRRANTQIAVAT